MNIKNLTSMLGLNQNTLRAWERRYQVVTPNRDDSGQRIYSRDDVTRLTLIVKLVEQGAPIGTLASLSTRELSGLCDPAPKREFRIDRFEQQVLRNLSEFNLEKIDRQLADIRSRVNITEFVLDYLVPLLHLVGECYVAGHVSIAQEHALVAILRKYLIEFTAFERQDSAPDLAFATPEGEWHEMGLLMATNIAAAAGHRVHYFGVNMPVDACVEALLKSKCRYLILATTLSTNNVLKDFLSEYIKNIAEHCPGKHVVIGGPARVGAGVRTLGRHFSIVPTLEDFIAFLKKINPSAGGHVESI